MTLFSSTMASCTRTPQIQISRTKAIHWFDLISFFCCVRITRARRVRDHSFTSSSSLFYFLITFSIVRLLNGGLGLATSQASHTNSVFCARLFIGTACRAIVAKTHDTLSMPFLFAWIFRFSIVVADVAPYQANGKHWLFFFEVRIRQYTDFGY